MNYTKKIGSILLSLICICPQTWAMKSSVSVPENLSRGIAKPAEDSPYAISKLCDRIIVSAADIPIDTLIGDTCYACTEAFLRIKDLLREKNLPNNNFYIVGLSNYIPIIEKLNYIMYNCILNKSDNIKQFFIPSPKTKSNLSSAIFTIASAVKKYGTIFYTDLFSTYSTNPRSETIHEIYDLLNETWEGIWSISQLNSFVE